MQRLQRELAPTLDAIRRYELDNATRSALLAECLQRVPELAGLLVAGPGAEPDAAAFVSLEARVADRALALLEGLLRLAVTRTAPCYAPDVIARRIDPVLELGTVIRHHRSSSDRSAP